MPLINTKQLKNAIFKRFLLKQNYFLVSNINFEYYQYKFGRSQISVQRYMELED